jgi:hypothetical protein
VSAAPYHHGEPPRQRFEPPAMAMVVRGLFFAAAAAIGAVAAARAARRPVSGVLLTPPLALVSLLLAWAGAIHLGGGARFDDHPWV